MTEKGAKLGLDERSRHNTGYTQNKASFDKFDTSFIGSFAWSHPDRSYFEDT
jgi:hypothetical protein